MSPGHFEKVREQIGCCGIWCGSCVVGNGALAEITRRYERLVELHDLRSWGPQDFDYDQFAKGLRSIGSMAPCPGCGKGGGRDNCELRSCATARGLSGCTECGEWEECPHGELLEHMRSGALRAGLLVKEGAAGSSSDADLLRDWVEEIRSRWPQSVIFDGQSDRW